MSTTPWPVILIPGDDPPQIQGSPRLEQLKEYGDVVLFDNRPQTEAELIERANNVTCVINSRGQVKWPGHVLKQLPKLKLITVCGIGTDPIDLEVAKEQGIVVSNIPGKTSPIIAEHAFALMLAVSRCTSFFTQKMKQGEWPLWPATSLFGKTLGVIGTGNIGCEMIRLSKAFGMNVVAWSYHASEEKAQRLGFQYVEFDELLKQSDVISLHVQLTDDSRNLIGERELSLMKPGLLLVNTARGAIVESKALVNALNSGHLAGAGLDVFATEPLPADDPILNCDHVVLTPHCADQVPEGVDLLNSGCVENVIAFFEGRPQNVVNG
jgi:phosphoglycerate dehydrogenase-like enzyme